MTVQEMIHELTKYDMNAEVCFYLSGHFIAEGETAVDLKSKDNIQRVVVDADFNHTVEFSSISRELRRGEKPRVFINLLHHDLI